MELNCVNGLQCKKHGLSLGRKKVLGKNFFILDLKDFNEPLFFGLKSTWSENTLVYICSLNVLKRGFYTLPSVLFKIIKLALVLRYVLPYTGLTRKSCIQVDQTNT